MRCSLRHHIGPVYLDGDLMARHDAQLYARLYALGVCERCSESALVYPGGVP
jgi:hypothetical protein